MICARRTGSTEGRRRAGYPVRRTGQLRRLAGRYGSARARRRARIHGPGTVSGAAYGAAMSTRWAGASGRYQAACEQGHCALTGGEASSKHEGQIFALLSYVIGPGQHDVRQDRIPGRSGRHGVSPDGGRILAVEYDGAYWHRGREERDLRKTDMIQWSGQYRVVRIREFPLQPLTPLDLQVPPRADAAECVRLTLLHLVHALCPDLDQDGLRRIRDFLNASVQPLESGHIQCGICRQVAQDRIGSRYPFTDRQMRGPTRSAAGTRVGIRSAGPRPARPARDGTA
jgi:hypothetical protein